MDNSENLKRCGWSVIYKSAFYGSAISILLTIGVGLYGGLYGLNFINPSAHFLCKFFGYDTQAYHGWAGADLVDFVLLPTLTNAILLFIAGTVVGWLIQKTKTV